MPSTYTTNTGLEKPGDGEQSGSWGGTVNDNMDILDRALNGIGSIALSGTTHTLTTSDGTLSDGQYRVLVLGGSPSGTNTITLSPNDAQHLYFVKNSSGQSAVFTQGSGGNVTVADGKSAVIYADGGGASAAVVDITSTFNFQPLTATLTAIGALATTDNNIIVGNGTTWVAESGATARTSLGLGSIATQAANNVSITGGSITGITDLALADGGTGASDAPTARTNLGLAIGTDVQAYDPDLAAIASLSSNGIIARTGSGTVAARTITAGTGITVTNGDGVSGDPTFAATLASEAQAQAGTDNTTLMTPLRTAQAIDQYLVLRSVTVDLSSASSFVARSLGTTVKNTISGASVSSPTFTLPAGKYLFRTSAMAYQTNGHYIKLRNTTDSTDTLVGSDSYSRNNSDAHPTISLIDSYFEIAATKNFQVQHYAQVGSKPLAMSTSDGTTQQTLSVIVQKIG